MLKVWCYRRVHAGGLPGPSQLMDTEQRRDGCTQPALLPSTHRLVSGSARIEPSSSRCRPSNDSCRLRRQADTSSRDMAGGNCGWGAEGGQPRGASASAAGGGSGGSEAG